MTIKETISEWLGEVRTDIGKKYEEIEHFGIFAKDANFPDLIETNIEEVNGLYKSQVLGPYYTYWLEHGRGPTLDPTPHNPTVREVVLRWIKKYGVQAYNKKYNQSTLAFFISKSIHENGIKVPGKYNPGGLISDVITQQRVQDLYRKVGQVFINEIRSDVIKELKA
jgi:hypothetical protein